MIDLQICSLLEAEEIVTSHPRLYRVVSILSTPLIGKLSLNETRKTIINGAKEILCLNFDDVEKSSGPWCQLATVDDCRQALDFLQQGGKCLVHCEAGISRSTAIVLGYLLTQYPTYAQAVHHLYQIRQYACPNVHILRLMCQILCKIQEYEYILKYTELVRINFPLQGICPLRKEDIREPRSFIAKLKNATQASDPISFYLKSKLTSEVQQQITDYHEAATLSELFLTNLVDDLGHLLATPLYQEEIFARAQLSQEIQAFLPHVLVAAPETIWRCNRCLLEEIYPEIAKLSKKAKRISLYFTNGKL